jgi:type IV secretory pathway VirB4 component
MFLIKQGHHSVVCELNLKGFDYELNIISGRIGNIEVMNRIIAEVGQDPAQWLPRFREATAKSASRTLAAQMSEKRTQLVETT